MMLDGQPTPDSPVWVSLLERLRQELGPDTRLVFPRTWTEQHTIWFHKIESESFRAELRYSDREIMERLERPKSMAMFVVTEEQPEAVLLGYPLGESTTRKFYLDTMAVMKRGRGLGRLILQTLIDWLKNQGYTSLQLDTEEFNEIGIPLVSFYTKLGFAVLSQDKTGNVSMELVLRPLVS
ncbi:MAG: GNAT family N-acetyltransferase [Candidatus Thorarchaeota archaeon]|nr:GNAT family N-acetyltransferase [Candidatus Thorarchaeota archaeon]